MPPMKVPQMPSMWMCIELRSKNEIHRTEQTRAGVKEIKLDRLTHVENREGNKYAQRDDLLHDFELRQTERGEGDTIGWNSQQVFKQRDAPTHQRGDVPGFVVEMF